MKAITVPPKTGTSSVSLHKVDFTTDAEAQISYVSSTYTSVKLTFKNVSATEGVYRIVTGDDKKRTVRTHLRGSGAPCRPAHDRREADILTANALLVVPSQPCGRQTDCVLGSLSGLDLSVWLGSFKQLENLVLQEFDGWSNKLAWWTFPCTRHTCVVLPSPCLGAG